MAVYHVLKPGGWHLQAANIIAFGIIPFLFGSMLFWIEISHNVLLSSPMDLVVNPLDESVLVLPMHQVNPKGTTFTLHTP
jgi:hypothetical protein